MKWYFEGGCLESSHIFDYHSIHFGISCYLFASFHACILRINTSLFVFLNRYLNAYIILLIHLILILAADFFIKDFLFEKDFLYLYHRLFFDFDLLMTLMNQLTFYNTLILSTNFQLSFLRIY